MYIISDIQLLYKEGDAENFQNSDEKLSTNISNPHFPLKREISISSFTYL